MAAAEVDVPFLVVGAGPTGMTLAKLLAAAGQRCLVVERRDGPQPNPSAHAVNARSLEIFRQAGFDMGAIMAIAQDPADAGQVTFVTTLAGELIGTLPYERQGDECLAVTPTPLRNISQHRLEPVLAADLEASETVELRYGTEWVSCTQDGGEVRSVLRDRATGEEVTIRSGYLLAADGASSAVRRSLDIEMVGPASIQDFVAIHFLADLRSIVADRPGIVHFVMDPECGGTLVAHDIDREWVFMYSYDAATEQIDGSNPEDFAGAVLAAIGSDTVDLEILRVGTWHMTAQVAARFGRGRCFLVGDAAHRFPPTGGLGLNTGVADAQNLVWKLVAVEDGWAPASLLESYELERRPIAETNCDQSLANAFKMILLAEALGLGPGATSADLAAVLADPGRAETIAAAVAEQATHFDMLGLQLGYSYAAGAVVAADEPQAPLSDPSRFTPKAAVGERLPHGWLEDGRSTLDVVAPDVLTLVSFADHERWHTALAGIDVPVRHLRVGIDVDWPEGWSEQFGPGPIGALLVRPDQHIAWRTDGSAGASPAEVHAAITTVVSGGTRP